MNDMALKQSVSLISQSDIYPHHGSISRAMRNSRTGHKSGVIWLTGLSGSGKSTIATQVEMDLFNAGYQVSIMDGDTVRAGLCADLDFSTESRTENLRRAAEVASLFADAGHIVIASFISPHNAGREFVRKIVRDNFYLVHVRASVDDCIERDPKGLYKKAMSGEVKNFTGICQSYEVPEKTDLVIDTSSNDVTSCSHTLQDFIQSNFSL